MKLLIADDEILTREGLISSIDWNSLYIDTILQAEDGLDAYRIACEQKPDIILSDIRIPRLSGIEFASKLKDALPDAILIFMSGYSDKEYLKAAIRLKAVTYVEKPLDLNEIREAVNEAVHLRLEKQQTRQNQMLHSLASSNRLALLLTRPYLDNAEKIESLAADLNLQTVGNIAITTYVVKSASKDINDLVMNNALNDFKNFLANFHLQNCYVRMHAIFHIFHIIGNTSPSDIALSSVEKKLAELFSPFGNYYIGKGLTVTNITKVYSSFTSAVIILQSSFFCPPGTVLRSEEHTDTVSATSPVTAETASSDFREALLSNDRNSVDRFLDSLFKTYDRNTHLLPAQAKDLYYRLFATLENCRQKMKLSSDTALLNGGIMQELEEAFSLEELHQTLCQKTDQFFAAMKDSAEEDRTIFLIKDYIGKHYSEEQLSIKEIGDHVFLSASYVCTYFKNQTGQTLNQYLTEYRMDRAMQLLKDARFQIADISAKVGYSNGNYFGKSFKKFTGLTPSQYREKMME